LNGDCFCFVGTPDLPIRRKTAIQTLIAAYILLGIGLTLLSNGYWNPSKVFVKDKPTKTKFHTAPLRGAIVLLLGEGTVCLWYVLLLDVYEFCAVPNVTCYCGWICY